MIVDILLTVAQVFVFLYDVVTYPIYQVVNRIKRAYLKNKVSQSVVYEDSKVIPSRKTTYNSPRIHKKSHQVAANPDPFREGDEYL